MNERTLACDAAARVLTLVKERIGEAHFDSWFSNVTCIPSDDGLEVRAPMPFILEWIRTKYHSVLVQAVAEVTDIGSDLRYVVDPQTSSETGERDGRIPSRPDLPPAPTETPFERNARYLRRYSDIQLHEEYRFENFVVGSGNQLPNAAALSVAEDPGATYNPLFLHGAVGLGKTHLMQAICHGLLAHEREIRVVYLTCETFVNQFIAAIEAGKLEDFRQRYRRVDVLLVDDVQFLARKERTQEEFFHTFNTLHENRRQIVLSSDCSPKEIPNLEQRLVSRFKMGLVAQLHPPDFETRVAIVKKKSRLKGTELGHEVAALIAARITSNIRELEGAVTKVLGYGTLLGRDIDLDLAREALYDGVRGETPRIGCDRIIELTAAHFGIGKTELQSRRRTKSIVHPRQVGMFLARKLTRHSLHEIGTFFGNRDHSTVLHAADKIGRALADGDEELKSHVAQLEALLKGDR